MRGVDLRTRISLFCGVLALAIGIAILLRGRPRRVELLFFAFAADIGLWYLAQWLYLFVQADVWAQFTAMLAVFLPQFAVHLFEAIVPQLERRSTLVRVAGILMVPMVVLVLSPLHQHPRVRFLVFLYVFGLLLAGFWSLAYRGARSRSRTTRRRIQFLALVGALAAAFSLTDFLWFLGAPLPPVGAVLSIVFLFALSQSLVRQRLLDIYEIVGQILVSTVLAFLLAGIFYLLVVLFGGFKQAFLAAILASIVILVLFEPLRGLVEFHIQKAFLRERVELERAVASARSDLATTLQVEQMASLVLGPLEGSGRATGGALYLRDPTGSYFDLLEAFGPEAPSRIEEAAVVPLVDRLTSGSSVFLEHFRLEVEEARHTGWARQAEADQRLLAACEVLGPFKNALCVGLHGDRSFLLGWLLLYDDRYADAYTPDEVVLLEELAVQIGVVVENSMQYRRMRERDRLAVLGQMAAGLAHEVKNPLGAIKGAAQLLSDPPAGSELDPGSSEFVSIILEEVDRLDRVVGSVLDYARPTKGDPGPVDLNAVVRRTLQVMGTDRLENCEMVTDLAEPLPFARADAEHLRQVLYNLVHNAIQAVDGRGRITVSTRERSRPGEAGISRGTGCWVEVAVQDQGPGIPKQVRESLFVPFVTTKHKGTGLGLAISQRMVQEMGGRIEVVSQPGSGATFTVVLPGTGDSLRQRLSSPRPPEVREAMEPATPARGPLAIGDSSSGRPLGSSPAGPVAGERRDG
ncbi:MAG: two-component system sensor protein [Polyangiaceae bacterium]|nr:two-component system sensor protein [Polyangiaceae bacterium]